MSKKTVVVIAGPTAVGKTKIAVDLAKHFNTAVLSADSRQCYREMEIGTAAPNNAEMDGVPHYFIKSHSILDELNVADYETYALGILTELFNKHDIVIVCGGTGLYINALCNGIDKMPEVPSSITNEIQQAFESKGLTWLQEELAQKDPQFWQQAEQQNPVRLIRALAFFNAHNVSILKYQTHTKKKRPFNVIKICIQMERSVLYNRINSRVDKMMADGLYNEVKSLAKYQHLKNLQTVGYSEFYQHPAFPTLNASSLTTIVDKIKQHTRNYAKRQITWFKKDNAYTYFHPSQLEEIIHHIEQQY